MIKRFLSYVEIMTKITSIFAFLLTLSFLFYRKQPINWTLTFLFFVSMFLFDLTTTAINNYIDTKTNDQQLQFKRTSAKIIIYVLLFLSTAAGLYLAYLTDIVVLMVGALCFFCGVLYTYGPIPISRQPLGEIISGIFYGLIIPFILLYVNMPAGTYLTLQLGFDTITVSLKLIPIVHLILFSVAPICTTANIMLANNICDLEKDIKVKRYTLPYYLGEKALFLYAGLYYLIYIATIIMVILHVLSPLYLLTLLTLIFVQKNIHQFFEKQDKRTTFLTAIKNYIIIMAANTIIIFLSGLHF